MHAQREKTLPATTISETAAKVSRYKTQGSQTTLGTQVPPTGVLTWVLGELGFYYGACCLYCLRSDEENMSTTKYPYH